MSQKSEHDRIIDAYKKMDEQIQQEQHFFAYRDSAHFFRLQRRYWDTLSLLKRRGIHNIEKVRILDVGCGDGRMLREFLQWGAKPENLAGIELRPEPVEYSLTLNPNLDIRCGSATDLPWPDDVFDLVCQHTVFTSILDQEIKKEIASEMLRVVNDNGVILWYDFWLNPTNPQTRGIRPGEIKQLFPGCSFEFHKITLAPPLARRVVPVSWGLAYGLERLTIFNSHYLVAIRLLLTCSSPKA